MAVAFVPPRERPYSCNIVQLREKILYSHCFKVHLSFGQWLVSRSRTFVFYLPFVFFYKHFPFLNVTSTIY